MRGSASPCPEYYPENFARPRWSGQRHHLRWQLSGGASQAGVFGLRWRLFDFGRVDARSLLPKARSRSAGRLPSRRAARDAGCRERVFRLDQARSTEKILARGEAAFAPCARRFVRRLPGRRGQPDRGARTRTAACCKMRGACPRAGTGRIGQRGDRFVPAGRRFVPPMRLRWPASAIINRVRKKRRQKQSSGQ